jgi:hypothetical protein
MRASDLIVGESYRHKDHPNYCWAKVLKVLKPKEGENTTSKILVKCEWSQNKDDVFGFIKYFKPADLTKEKS